MVKHTSFLIGIVATLFLLNVTPMRACLTTFINDKMSKVMIYNKQDKTFICIRRNEKRRFGNQHQRADFAIYIQQQNKPIFSRAYTCTQVACSRASNIHLKLSDIEKGTGAAQLFDISKSKVHASMAQELPFMPKQCVSCNKE